MSDHENKSEHPQPDALRRRLVKGGLATPAVLATLASKQVLGSAPYNCSMSGKLSGNVSGHGKAQTCSSLGSSCEQWRDTTCQWTYYPKGSCTQHVYSGGQCMYIDDYNTSNNTSKRGCRVKEASLTVTTPKFLNQYCRKQVSGKWQMCAPTTSGCTPMSLLEILWCDSITTPQYGVSCNFDLVKECVAGVLNARAYPMIYPLAEADCIAMHNATCNGGTYQVTPTVSWTAQQCIAYLCSLHA